jgi:beta-lactamase class A
MRTIGSLTLALAFAFAIQTPPSADVEAISQSVSGVTGIEAHVLGTGRTVSVKADERFPMQSVYKVPIVMAVLDQAAHGVINLSQKVRVTKDDLVPQVHSPMRDAHPDGGFDVSVEELMRAAVVDSDGTASDVLYKLAGGGPRVAAYVRGLGIRDMAIVATEREMAADEMVQYRNFSTPHAAVQLLEAIQTGRGMSVPHRERLLRWMRETRTGVNRIRAGSPGDAVVADKTGTDGTRNGLTRATNDIGLVTMPDGRTVAIAIFIKDSRADAAARERAIARLTAAALSQLRPTASPTTAPR